MNFSCLFQFFLIIHLCCINGQSSDEDDLKYQSYNSKGEVLQFEYAEKAIERSNGVVCFYNPSENCKVILTMHNRISPLIKRDDTENSLTLRRIRFPDGKRLLSCSVGYPADCRFVDNELQQLLVRHQYKYGGFPSLHYLCNKLADFYVDGLYPSEEEDDSEENERKQPRKKVRRPLAASTILYSLANSRDKNDPLSSNLNKFAVIAHTGSVSFRNNLLVGKFNENSKKEILEILEFPSLSSLSSEEKITKIMGLLQEEYDYYEGCIIDDDSSDENKKNEENQQPLVKIINLTPLIGKNKV
jgi:hypothetical protein